MPWHFAKLTESQAKNITAWRYPPPYDLYNAANDQEELDELLNRDSPYYGVTNGHGGLIGFFCFNETARVPAGHRAGAYAEPGAVDLGLGMRPDLTGKGLGLPFVLAGIEFARSTFTPTLFRLTVATFNARAMRVYERAGFRRMVVFNSYTSSGEHEFLTMVRAAD
ncbi:MAG: family N-acetyltransferase [Chloroflexi bacterium]|nr:family N-acetyltransferase [Chloroflexota bacterium]